MILKHDNTYKIGVFWSFASAFLWSTTFVSARYLMKDGAIDAVSLSLIRFVLGGGILFVLGVVFFRKKLFSVNLKDLFQLALLGLFGIVGMSVFLFVGQKDTTAINSSMIMQINPVIILLGGLFIGEKIRPIQVLGIFMSLIGCMFVVDVITLRGFAYKPDHMRGDLFVLLAAICWAIYSVWGKKVVKRVGGYAATTWAMLLGAVELLILRLVLPMEFNLPDSAFHWSVILYLAAFPTAVAFFAWYEAMDKIELSLLNVMQYLTPVFTIVLAWLILSEQFSLMNAFGVLLVVAGVVFTVERKKRKLAPDV